jgi:hypothetical protein
MAKQNFRLNNTRNGIKDWFIYLDRTDLEGDVNSIVESLQRVQEEARAKNITNVQIYFETVQEYGKEYDRVVLTGDVEIEEEKKNG